MAAAPGLGRRSPQPEGTLDPNPKPSGQLDGGEGLIPPAQGLGVSSWEGSVHCVTLSSRLHLSELRCPHLKQG